MYYSNTPSSTPSSTPSIAPGIAPGIGAWRAAAVGAPPSQQRSLWTAASHTRTVHTRNLPLHTMLTLTLPGTLLFTSVLLTRGGRCMTPPPGIFISHPHIVIPRFEEEAPSLHPFLFTPLPFHTPPIYIPPMHPSRPFHSRES